MATTDEVMNEVYAHRDQLARENGYDLRRIVEALKSGSVERVRLRACPHDREGDSPVAPLVAVKVVMVPMRLLTTSKNGSAMAYNRPSALPERPRDEELTRDMAGIGMNFAVEPNLEAPIEETLVHASSLGMEEGDLRVLSVLTTWLGVHAAHINADRLVRCVSDHPSPRVRAYWAAIACWLVKDRRFARLMQLHRGMALDLLPVGTEFQISRRGEDPRFVGSALRVPAGTLRDREADVLAPEFLVRRHAGYRNRVRMGPTWRADVWTVLEHSPGLSVAEAARRAGCSFAAAWQVVHDFTLLRESGQLDASS